MPEEKEKKATHKLVNLTVHKVDIVDEPATGERFVQIRSAGGGGEMPKRTAMRASTAKQIEEANGSSSDKPTMLNINVERGGVIHLNTDDQPVETIEEEPVERTVNDNSNDKPLENEEMNELKEKVNRLTAVIERMEGSPLFKDILNPAPPDPKKDEEEAPAASDATPPEGQETLPAETPVVAPVVTPETTSTETPTEQPSAEPAVPVVTSEAPAAPAPVVTTPVETPIPAEAPAPAQAASESSVAGVATAVERLGGIVEKLGEQVGKFTGRLDSVERSIKSGGNALDQDETETVDRGGKKKSLFAGIV